MQIENAVPAPCSLKKLLKAVLFMHLLTKINAHNSFYPSMPDKARIMLNQCQSDWE